MSELADSIAEAIRKRAVSSTLGTYLFFWCAFHWEGIYTTLFTNQDLIYGKFGMLKNEYVAHYFFGWQGWRTILSYLVPLLLTALFIWPIPKYVLIHAFRQEQRHKVDKRRVKIEEEEKIQVKKRSLAVEAEKTLKAEIKTSKAREEAVSVDPTILWKKEFQDSFGPRLYETLSDISEAVYRGGGAITQHYDQTLGAWLGANLSKDAIAFAHTNDLITVTSKGIALTDKGKFFVKEMYKKDLSDDSSL